MLTRERLPVPTSVLPASAPLPNLRVALTRRAEFFGPYDGDGVPAAPVPHGPAQALGVLARRVVAALDLRRAS